MKTHAVFRRHGFPNEDQGQVLCPMTLKFPLMIIPIRLLIPGLPSFKPLARRRRKIDSLQNLMSRCGSFFHESP